MLTIGESSASSSNTAFLMPLSNCPLHWTFAAAVSSSKFPSPSDIVAEGSVRSSNNACSWGASTCLLGSDLCRTNSPVHAAIESTARFAVCVGLCGVSLLTTGERCATSSNIALPMPLFLHIHCAGHMLVQQSLQVVPALVRVLCNPMVNNLLPEQSKTCQSPPLHVQNAGHLIVQQSLQVVPDL